MPADAIVLGIEDEAIRQGPNGIKASVLLALAGALVVAPLLHELTHAIVAWPVSERVSVGRDGLGLVTGYDLRDDAPAWSVRVIGLAPQLVGTGVALAWLASRGLPTGPYAPVVVAGWAMFVWGSIEDFSVAAQRGETPAAVAWWRECHPADRDRLLAAGVFLAVAVGALAATFAGPGVWFVAAHAAAAGSLVVGWLLVAAERRDDRVEAFG